MSYAELREEGIGRLREMAEAGGSWTDFNAHDPGITILEQAAYAMSDLLYRVGYSVPDLLASGDADPRGCLFPPEEILPCDPVTATDLRRLVVDVAGVRNAWVEPSTALGVELHYHRSRSEGELGLVADPPATEPVTPVGLYRVLIDAFDQHASAAVLARVASTLHAHRPVGTDFTEIHALERQDVQVDATIEIDPVEDAESVLLAVLEAIADHLSPPVGFVDVDRAKRDGVPIDEILDGPRLHRGYLPAGALDETPRRTAVRTSDLVQAITDVPGTRAVTGITVAAGGTEHPWSVDLSPDHTPRLDPFGSNIVLTRVGLQAVSDVDGVRKRFLSREEARDAGPAATSPPALSSRLPPKTPGRDRSVGTYRSLQHDLPALYGVAEMGLPDSAEPARRAQAKQLKAYLLFFDQLLANMFAQLAHVGDLFSFEPASRRTYFSEVVDDGRLGLDDVRDADLVEHGRLLAEMADPRFTADPAAGAAPSRRDRFLTHLLARFAEQFADAALVAGGAGTGGGSLIDEKRAFLGRYPRVSGARGAGVDTLRPLGDDNQSGLGERIRLKLGLDRESGEDFVLVEHILLRPTASDADQVVPLVEESKLRDPYSLRLSFVFKAAGRMQDKIEHPETEEERELNRSRDQFRQLARHTIREETPAHLVVHDRWLVPDEWDAFAAAHQHWHDRRRRVLRGQFGLEVEGS